MHPLLKQCYEAAAGARSLASSFRSGEIGALRIALTHSVDLSILIPFLNQIKRQFNRLEFKFLRGNSREVAEMLKKGDAELGIAAELGQDWDRLDTWPLFTEDFQLVVSRRRCTTPPTWRKFFVSEGIPHRTDSEIEKICSSHLIEPGEFDKPMSVRYWEDWFDIEGGPLARAYHLLQKIDLGPERGSERGPLLEFNIGSHPSDSTHYVNAKDMLSLSLLQARLIDLGMPIKVVEGT